MNFNIRLCITLLLISYSSSIFTQNSWHTDSEMGYKISLPNHYQKNQFWDQGEKILVAVSPDQNVVIRIRSFKATEQFTTSLIQQAFEQSVITGATLLTREEGDLNGIPAVATAYSWGYNNINTVVGAYFILNGGTGYIVWTIIPLNLLQQRSGEADQIIDSFSLLAGNVSPHRNATDSSRKNQEHHSVGSSGVKAIRITDMVLGNERNRNYQLTQHKHIFPGDTHQIEMVFGYEGDSFDSDFVIKWFSDTHQTLIKEFHVTPPDSEGGRGHSFITNGGKRWPAGEYHVEIRYAGNLLMEKSFIIE